MMTTDNVIDKKRYVDNADEADAVLEERRNGTLVKYKDGSPEVFYNSTLAALQGVYSKLTIYIQKYGS